MPRPKKRAIALAGGGPAAGLHIGVLEVLEEAGIEFDVFSLSCVGAWVGLVYNTRKGKNRAAKTREYFEKHCFREDDSYQWFPVNRGFAPDFQAVFKAWNNFGQSKNRNWESLVLPEEIQRAMVSTMGMLVDTKRWNDQDFNYWMFNDVLAVNPLTRYLTSLMYHSEVNGLCKVYYENSPALAEIFKVDGISLSDPDQPEIYHNAWRLPVNGTPGEMQIFHNQRKTSAGGEKYMEICDLSLCACSALPFIEESVFIDGVEYSEGALIDTVNFRHLLRDHPNLDEIWINRIVDNKQVRPARDLVGSLSNLPMQFCAEVGENDVKLFRQHLIRQTGRWPRVVEVPIFGDTKVDFSWNRSNLEQGITEGRAATRHLLENDPRLFESTMD